MGIAYYSDTRQTLSEANELSVAKPGRQKWHREKNATTLTGHPQDSLTEVFCKARFVPTLVVSNPAIRPKCKDSTEHGRLVKTTETIQSHSHRRLVLPPLSPEEFIYNMHSPMVKTKTIELFPELYISLP